MMKFLKRHVSAILLLAFVSLVIASAAHGQCLDPPTGDTLIVPSQAASTKLILVTEEQLRQMAIKSVIPDLPKKEGGDTEKATAEAYIEVDEEGAVTHIKVFGVRDKKLKEVVTNAVKQWEFKPFIVYTDVNKGCFIGKRVRARGSLSFDHVRDRD